MKDGTVEGTLDGDRITLGVVVVSGTATFDGTLAGDEMHGTYHSPRDCGNDTGTWEAQTAS